MHLRSACLALVLPLLVGGSAAASALGVDIETYGRRFGWPGVAALEVGREGAQETVILGQCGPHRPLSVDTPLMLGSVSKAFTARAAQAASQRGSLDLDAPLSGQWPELDRLNRVTPRHLLTHTSGFTARQGMIVDRAAGLSRLSRPPPPEPDATQT